MGIAPNRLVAVLTPLVFAPLAGTVAALAAEHVPGLDVDPDQVQQIFIAGALIAFGKAALWLRGWQAWEQTQAAAAAGDALMEPEPDDAVLDADVDADDDELALADADPDPELELDEEDAAHDDDVLPGTNGFAAIGRD